MKKVLAFGISGFVGEYLAKELTKSGYDVYGTYNKCKVIPKECIEGYQCDILNSIQVNDVISSVNPDFIINLAAISSVGKSWEIPQCTMNVNVNGTLNILEGARKQNKLIRILLVGSSEEYANCKGPLSEEYPLSGNSPYGISKLAQEKFMELYNERYNMDIICVRAFNHTGVGQNDTFVIPSFCRQVAKIQKSNEPGEIFVGNIDVERDFCHVKDIVRAYRMILETKSAHKVYNVGSGCCHKLAELLQYIVSLNNQLIEIKVDSSKIRKNENPVMCCDLHLIASEVGWSPKLTIFDAIDELFEHYVQVL